jgi:hypothetical protein
MCPFPNVTTNLTEGKVMGFDFNREVTEVVYSLNIPSLEMRSIRFITLPEITPNRTSPINSGSHSSVTTVFIREFLRLWVGLCTG